MYIGVVPLTSMDLRRPTPTEDPAHRLQGHSAVGSTMPLCGSRAFLFYRVQCKRMQLKTKYLEPNSILNVREKRLTSYVNALLCWGPECKFRPPQAEKGQGHYEGNMLNIWVQGGNVLVLPKIISPSHG